MKASEDQQLPCLSYLTASKHENMTKLQPISINSVNYLKSFSEL